MMLFTFFKMLVVVFPRWLGCILLFFLLPQVVSKGCGPYRNLITGYSFVGTPLLLEAAKPAPFLLDFNFGEIYKYFGTETYRQEYANLKDWQERVCEEAELEEIKEIIYDADESTLRSIQSAMTNKRVVLPRELRRNQFVDYLLDNKCEETMDYLLYAKSCEPHAVLPKDSWEEPKRDYNRMSDLIEDGLVLFRRSQSHYLKQRYAYQIVRLAHYQKNYERTIALYDELVPKIDIAENVIYYWLLGHRAGALRALERYTEAAYLYVVIFANCPNRRESAFRSFLVRNDEDWKKVYLMCKTNSERSAMFAIRASASGSRALTSMEQIYKIDAKSDFLETLLVREIRKVEEQVLGIAPFGTKPHQRISHKTPKPNDQLGNYLVELQQFTIQCREEKKVKNISLWLIAEGYLEFLAGNYYQAEQTFMKAQQFVMNEDLKQELQVLSTVLKLAKMGEIDTDVEDELFEIYKKSAEWEEFPEFKEYFNDRVAQLYQQSGQVGLAFRAHYSINDLRYNPDIKVIDDLLETITRGDTVLTDFAAMLGRDTLGEDARLELLNIKATFLMSQHQYIRALNVWKQMDRALWSQFGTFSPFAERFLDRVHDASPDDRGIVVDTAVFSKGAIVEAILNADGEARTGSESAARQLYNIGCGLYNMSYFGYAWNAMDFYRSGGNNTPRYLAAKDGVVPFWGAPYGNRENFDLTIATLYFEDARTMALAQNDRELAAKAIFMAAKCEQKRCYTSGEYQLTNVRNYIPQLPEEYLTNFKLLKEQYTDTNFYGEIKSRCKYFEAYCR